MWGKSSERWTTTIGLALAAGLAGPGSAVAQSTEAASGVWADCQAMAAASATSDRDESMSDNGGEPGMGATSGGEAKGTAVNEAEREMLREQARALQCKRLWELRADAAKAQADYEEAEARRKKALRKQHGEDGDSAPDSDDTSPDSSATDAAGATADDDAISVSNEDLMALWRQKQHAESQRASQGAAAVNRTAAGGMRPAGVGGESGHQRTPPRMELLSVFGEQDHLIAEVSYRGGVIRLEEGASLDGATVASIEPTQVVLDEDGNETTLTLAGRE